MTAEPNFIVETFIVRRVRSKTQFQPYHATYLTGRGLKLRSKSFVEQRLIDRQEISRIFDLPSVPTEFPPLPPSMES